MLSLDNVTVGYRIKKEIIPVIQGLSLRVEQGEVLAILGPSGCGKSTLINMLAGTISQSGGSVEFMNGGQRLPLHPRTHKIGIIPQNCGLLPWKRVRANCVLPLVLRGEKLTQEREQDIRRVMADLGVDGLQQRFPKELSGGQAQRVAIARAFILRPDILLMDEPFSSLDAIHREEAAKLFLRVWQQTRPTTVLVTHSIEEALYLGHTVLVMGPHGGEVRHRMQNPYFAQLHPEDAAYAATARLLRRQLMPAGEGEADE